MDEIWERAVEAALEGQQDPSLTRTLTLDGAVKCLHGRLPPPAVLEKFQNLQHLSIANIGVSSLEQFPRLQNLQKLILSDNRIAGGLEFLVEAGLDSLRDLDLSNNRIQYIEDLAPLAQLRLVSLDLYECPVTRVKDYRSRVFGLIKSLRFLDKMDAEENERPETDEEEDEEDEEEEDDPGSGEIDGDERPYRLDNGHSEGGEGILDVDEDEESDADEEETETARRENGLSHQANGFQIGVAGDGEEDEDDVEDDEENDSGEEVDDDEGDEDDVAEVHEIDDSDDEDGVEDDEDDDDEDEEDEVDNEEGDFGEPESTCGLISTEGEIDGHEQGEDDGDEDDDGETGEEEQGLGEEEEYEEEDEDGEEEEEDNGAGYLVQPVVGQIEEEEADVGDSDMEAVNEEDEPEEEEEEEVDDDKNEEVQAHHPSSSNVKRKRDESSDEDEDVIESSKSSPKKKQR